MDKHSSPVTQATRRTAVSGLRHLLDEVQLAMVGLPDLHDAFDADDLPLAFILRRDSHLAASGRNVRLEGWWSDPEPGRTGRADE